MLPTFELPRRVAFGPFELNSSTGELTKSGIPVRLSGQPLKLLLVLVAQRGQVVTGEELRREVWSDGTFVDFEHGLHAAMNKLRRTLGDSAENPRYIETVPGRGYRFIGAFAPPQPGPISIADRSLPREERVVVKRRPIAWWVLIVAVFCAVSFVLGWLIHNAPAPLNAWKLTRLTTDPGLSDNPAISPDGTLLVYSSDRGEGGVRELYLKQIAGDQSIRLTFDGEGNTTPNFSPDGSKIVFHSNREGGGIYEIPTLGGEPRLLARDGLNPRFSPDGSKVAYWIGGETVAAAIPGSGAVWVVPVAGGEPRQVTWDFTGARYPVWSPDGQSLLFVGYTSKKAYERSAIDWWLISIDGQRAVRTGAYSALTRAGLQGRDSYAHDASPPNANCWSGWTDNVILSAQHDGSRNLWQTDISRSTGKATGVFNRLTTGAANEWEPSCSPEGPIVFTSLQIRRNLWSVPFNLDAGRSKGALGRITQTDERQEHASLSNDGRYVAFSSAQAGRLNIWLRELGTGKEFHVASSTLVQRFPVSNRSGSRIAFSVYEQDGKRSVYVSSLGGAPEKLCEGCLRATDWSGDEKALLMFGGDPYQISWLDIASRRQTVLVKHPSHQLLYGRFSPDNHWISFTERIPPNRSHIMIAPIDGLKPVAESAWIQIAEAGLEDWADWSPDGKTLYFTSTRDGHACFWGQRIDARSHRPVGEAFAALHLHGRLTYQQGGWSAAGDRIAMVLTEDTGNIWMLSRAKGR